MAPDDQSLVFYRRIFVTTSTHCQESGLSNVGAAVGRPLQLDYSRVRAYWGEAKPSLLSPYMMDGFGFPARAGWFRFRGESDAVEEAIKDLRSSISVLDFGSGVGVWTEYFAQRFANVVSVEASPTLYTALRDRCSRYPNVVTFGGDVLAFEPRPAPQLGEDLLLARFQAGDLHQSLSSSWSFSSSCHSM